MGEPFATHQFVGLECALEIGIVNAYGNPHEKLLGTFHWPTVYLQQVRSFQGLKPEEIVRVVSLVVNNLLNFLGIALDDLIDVIGEQWCILP